MNDGFLRYAVGVLRQAGWGRALSPTKYTSGPFIMRLPCVIQIDITEDSFLDLFPQESVIYLTPDAEQGGILPASRQCVLCL